MLKSKIFVSNYAGHDISNAFNYTNLPRNAQVNITEGSINIFNPSRLIFDIKLKLRDSKPKDFLLFSGNGLIFGLVLSIWLEKHGEANLLLYHQGDKKYCLKNITRKEVHD